MKKVFLSLLVVAATVNAMAIDFAAKATLTLTAGAAKCEIVVAQTNDNPASLCAPMNFTNRKIALYVKSADEKYELFAAENLEDVALGLMTNAETSYTLTASEVTGTPLTIKLLDGTIFTASEGASVTFTAEANQTEITGMVINPHAVPTEFKVCHQYGKIIVDNPETTAMDVVLDGEKIGEAAAQTFASEVPVTAAAGQHTLEINNQTLIISVQ